MKVRILIEFDVESMSSEDDNPLTEDHAKSAASQAAYDYLALVKVSGYTSEAESVEVHADGFGRCRVKLGEEHE